MDKQNIYIVDSFTNTVPGRIIKWRASLKFWNRYDGDCYSHTSLSRDKKLGNMMSLARKEINNPLNCGFIKEDIRKDVFALNKDESNIAVMELPVSLEQYKKISNLMDYYWTHRDEYSYNFIGVISMIMFGRGIAPKNSFFCSQWVAQVLKDSNVDIFYDYRNRNPEDIPPFLFYMVLKDKIIYEGPVLEYPYYNDLKYPGYVEDDKSKILIKDRQYSFDKRGIDDYARTKNT